MPPTDAPVAILLADIAGSTPLYERLGDAAALRAIGDCLDRLGAMIRREGGRSVHSKGDDMLCTFADPSAALRVARAMLAPGFAAPLAIHAGLHFGVVLPARGDIFGDAVNLTARLAAMANPGEVLASEDFVGRLPGAEAAGWRLLDALPLKGKASPVRVYSLLDGDAAIHTQISFGPAAARPATRDAAPETVVTLRHGERAWTCREGASLSIGRSAECDVVIGRPWVSRHHATVLVRRGKVQLCDQSSAGTHVTVQGGYEVFLRRETVLLVGSGTISPALRPADPGAEAIRYDIAAP